MSENQHITDAAMELFSDITVPRDSYERAMLSAYKAGFSLATLDANGLAIAQSFPPYFSSTTAMESGVAPHFAYLAKDIPRIKFMATQKGSPPPIIDAMLDTMRVTACEKNLIWALNLEREVMNHLDANTPLTMDYLPHQPPSVRMANFMVDNLSQHHRNAQIRFQLNAVSMLMQASKALDRACEASGNRWSLRPLVAMPGNQEATMMSLSPLRGLQSPQTYMNASNLLAAAQFDSLDLTHRLFHPFNVNEDGKEDAHTRLADYKWWIDSCAMGIIRFANADINLVVTPVGLPPQLVFPVRSSIPFYVHPIIPIPMMMDQVGVMTMLDTSQIDDESWLHLYERGSNQPIIPLMGRVLALVCAYATLVLSPIPWGRGHRKPTWMMSPPNANLIAHLNIVGPYLIAQLNQHLGHAI